MEILDNQLLPPPTSAKTRASRKVTRLKQLLRAFLSISMSGEPVSAQPTITISAPVTVSTYTQVVPSTQLPANMSVGSLMLPPVSKPVPLMDPINTLGGTGTNGSCTPAISATALIQDCHLGQSSFESNMVNLWLGIHGLPATDAPLIYQYCGIELRSELRSKDNLPDLAGFWNARQPRART
jgi:hypothetical protein